jgi:protein TonB
VSLDAWGRGERGDDGRGKRLAGSYVAAAVLVAALLAVGIAFGGQIKKQVFEEEVEVKFVPPPEPVKAPPPPPTTPPPTTKAAIRGSPPPLGAKQDAPPTEVPKDAPREGSPDKAAAEVPFGEGDPNGVVGGTGRGGGTVVAPTATTLPPPPPPPPPMQVAEVSTPPVPLAKAMPAYPEDARKQGIEALVVVKFVVGEDGKVSDVKVVKGHPLFDDIVLAAVRTWTFTPATLEGRPVRMARLVKIPFRLKTG